MASSASDVDAEISVRCACGQLSASLEVPTSKLPLPLQLCHCNTCRHLSGHLAITYVNLPAGEKPLRVYGKAERYGTSETLSRCFCGICGASVYEDSPDPKKLGFCGGALVKCDGIVKVYSHAFVQDTMDGGLRDWMPDLPAWEGLPNHSKQIPSGVFYSDILDNMNSANPSEKVHCRCHCGGVQFEITRPNHKSKQLHSPWGDAYCEHAKGGGKNLEDIKWWVRAEDTKWAASVCACNACRQGSGYDIQPWAFVAKTNIQQIGGDPLQFTMGTLKRYVISEGHYREFCRTCGAVIFWHCDARPALIDVSVGLMESSSGARAEDWLEWNTDRVSFEQFAQNKALIQNLEIGLKKWGKRLEI